MLGHTLTRIILVVLVWGLASMAAPARADEVTAGLAQASKMMQAGAYVKAIDLITNVLASGKAQADMAAKALLMRGQSNERLGKQAFALADYNQALWMQGLSASDKKLAEDSRARLQGTLNVKEPAAETQPAAMQTSSTTLASGAGSAPSPRPTRTAPPTALGFDESPPPRQAQQASSSGSGVGGFFSSLFGSTEPLRAEREEHAVVAVVQPAPVAPRPQARAAAVASPQAWGATRTAEATTQTARPVASGPTGFSIQFAALTSEDKAISEVNRVAKKFGADLEGRSPSVMIVGTKEGDTLYKIVAGPFATKAEGIAKCDELKTKGANCMVISIK